MIRGPAVVVASGHEPTLIGLRVVLERGGCRVVAAVRTAGDAAAATARESADICLLDAVMPGADGVEATRAVKRAAPQARVVLLAGGDSDDLMLAALRAGADGLLDKRMGLGRLATTLRRVAAGEAALPRRQLGALVRAYREEPEGAVPTIEASLTARERDVLELLLGGASTSEAAYELGLSAVTVRRHVAGIVRKAHAGGRDGALAAARAERHGALQLNSHPASRRPA